MKLKRCKHVFSERRRRACRKLFRNPASAALKLSFVAAGNFRVTLRDGQSLTFSRRGRDHRLWDWLLERVGAGDDVGVQFDDQGDVLLDWHGQSIRLRPGSEDFFVFEEIFLNDEYGIQSAGTAFDTVVDLGANAGLFAVAVLPRARRVLCVEAVAANHAQAVRNVVRNGGSAEDVWHGAVTQFSGERVQLVCDARNSGGHSVFGDWAARSGPAAHVEEVEGISLPDLLDRAGVADVDLLKCDIEGSEYAVFRGASDALLRRIRRIVMELHFWPGLDESQPRQLIDRLKAAGHRVHLEPGLPSPPYGDKIACLLRTESHQDAQKAA